MPTAAEERVREALRGKLEHAVSYFGRTADYGTVVSIDPIRVELHEEGHTIEEDEDLTLGHEVKQYVADYGDLVPADDDDDGDTLVVHRMSDGDWVAVSVLHDTEVSASARAEELAARAAAPAPSMVGLVQEWTRRVAPEGYVIADGSRYAADLYPEAYAVATEEAEHPGSLWTARDADRTFTVPDLTALTPTRIVRIKD